MAEKLQDKARTLFGARTPLWLAVIGGYGLFFAYALWQGLSATSVNFLTFVGAFIFGAAVFSIQSARANRRSEQERRQKLNTLYGR
jgi:4-hydroxybenzoate polyprenyltransferase